MLLDGSHRTGLDPLWPSRCVNSISSSSFPPIEKEFEALNHCTAESYPSLTMDGVHDLNTSIGIPIPQSSENKIHESFEE